MTPDQRFARWVQVAIAVFVLLFVYFLVADLWMPLTPQAQLTRPVVRVAPRVSGQVAEVLVSNNGHVQPGEVLFRLDPEPFRLAVRQAELALEEAERTNRELDAAIASAKADLLAARSSAGELDSEARRTAQLVQRHHVSQQMHEQVSAQAQAARARVAAAQARIGELTARRGTAGEDNLRLRQARNALAQARLQLQYSSVRADRAGTLSNLQLTPGTYVPAGTPVAALVDDRIDIVADFREKSLRYVRPGDRAAVVFDARPGEVFGARVAAIDAGVKEGQLDANGDLAAPVTSDRWVRDAQRQRLHVVLDELPEGLLPTGLFVYRFALMARGPLFFFGALSSVFLSMLLHFASYPDVDLFDMLASNMVATWLTVAIAVLMFYLFPDVEPRPPRQAPAKDAPSRRHETLLGATVATLSFVVFQTFDLKDSLSAQIASILVLFPMHWKGVHFAGRIRALGTLLGCALAVGLQVLLYDHYDILPFVALLLWISAMFCARIHMLENGVPGIGFGALTTLAIVLGQYLTPTHDMMYSVLYRFTSVCFAVLITLMTVLVIHLFLNRFAATRHYSH